MHCLAQCPHGVHAVELPSRTAVLNMRHAVVSVGSYGCVSLLAQVSYQLPGPATTNKHGLKDDIQMVLLDERYFRATLPCSAREKW